MVEAISIHQCFTRNDSLHSHLSFRAEPVSGGSTTATAGSDANVSKEDGPGDFRVSRVVTFPQRTESRESFGSSIPGLQDISNRLAEVLDDAPVTHRAVKSLWDAGVAFSTKTL
jgi:hypothetical protein